MVEQHPGVPGRLGPPRRMPKGNKWATSCWQRAKLCSLLPLCEPNVMARHKCRMGCTWTIVCRERTKLGTLVSQCVPLWGPSWNRSGVDWLYLYWTAAHKQRASIAA
jgi:hypothetical protein